MSLLVFSMCDHFFDSLWCLITIYNFEKRADKFCEALLLFSVSLVSE